MEISVTGLRYLYHTFVDLLWQKTKCGFTVWELICYEIVETSKIWNVTHACTHACCTFPDAKTRTKLINLNNLIKLSRHQIYRGFNLPFLTATTYKPYTLTILPTVEQGIRLSSFCVHNRNHKAIIQIQSTKIGLVEHTHYTLQLVGLVLFIIAQ